MILKRSSVEADVVVSSAVDAVDTVQRPVFSRTVPFGTELIAAMRAKE